MSLIAALPDLTAVARPVAWARIMIGVAALAKVGLYLHFALPLTEPGALQAPMLEVLPAPSRGWMLGLGAVWSIAGVLFALGWRTRGAGAVLTVCLAASLLIDEQLYSNHLYLLALIVFLLTWADSGASLSLDARRGGGRERIEGLPILLAQLMPAVVYGFAALTKVNVYWLSGALLAGSLRTDGLLTVPSALARPPWVTGAALGVVLLESALAFYLYRPSTRRRAAAAALLMHAGMTLFVVETLELAVFTLMMASLLALTLSAGTIDELRAAGRRAHQTTSSV